MPFRLIDVRWMKRYNALRCYCTQCAYWIWHPMNRTWIVCPKCGGRSHIDEVRLQHLPGCACERCQRLVENRRQVRQRPDRGK